MYKKELKHKVKLLYKKTFLFYNEENERKGGNIMRLRNVKGSRETIASNEFVVQNGEQYKGSWAKYDRG